ncbi:zinc finger, CCHC-type containing protein [Tanacetum coccineum]
MVVAAIKYMASNFAKLDKFEGVDFRRLKKKMRFLLFSMSVVYVLTTPIPEDSENATVDQIRRRNKWDNDDYVCRGLILKGMSNPLFDIYQSVESSKELWDSMKAKYMVEDASSKKFLISNFINYKMTDSRPVMEQYNELFVGGHLRFEESLKAQDSDKPKGNNVVGPQLNIVNVIGNLTFMSTFKLNDSIIWHASLGQVHFKRMQDMSKDGLILAFDIDTEKPVVRLPNPKLKTLGERGIEYIFFEYAEHSKDFRFYVIEPNESVSINSIVESKDAIFDKNRFSLVSRPSQRSLINGTEEHCIIRLLIAMESIHNMIIHQMDVETAFLNGEVVKESSFVCMFLYVDDMLIFGSNQVQVDLTKEFLSSKFSMKDMRVADVILGIRIKHESNRMAISQSYYIEKVLKKFNYFDCTLVSTSIDTSEKVIPNNGQTVSQLEYSKVIGCLMYVMTCTRPGIAFAVDKLSRYTSNTGTQHWQAIQVVPKFLKKTMDYSLTYIGYSSVLEGYTDASWINNTEKNSSTSGWVFMLDGGAIFWASKKQTCITGSTMESKFVALAAAGKEAEWLRNLILEIPLWSKLIALISIRCDSAATLAKAYSKMYNGKFRHLGVRHRMIVNLSRMGWYL